jgi:putative helicase MOV10L1
VPIPKIGSVEEFQGQERKVIILSAVRSSPTLIKTDICHALGFIASPKRLNVALTRARALLIILGNPHLLARDPYWRSVLNYCVKHGGYTGCDLPIDYSSLTLDGFV